MIGRSVGSYRIVEKLGEGGMGVVYRAVHPLLGKRAAVKVLLPEMSRDPTALERFFQEARSTALIGHPGIVDVFDYGHLDDGCAYLVMELLPGDSLTERLKREGRMSPVQAVAIARQIASAVGAAHQAGVVHRDLKPDNLFLIPDREASSGFRLKVLDFGVAKLADRVRPSHVTQANIALGSPRYMSPEQCRNASAVDGRTDIYSLGCMLHEMLSGQPPFDRPSFAELMTAQMIEPPPKLRTVVPSLPQALEEVVWKALAKNPADRFHTMDEMAKALEAVGPNLRDSVPAVVPSAAASTGPRETSTLSHAASQVSMTTEGGSRRRLLWPAAIGVLVGLVGFVVFLVLREPPEEPRVSEVIVNATDPASAPAAKPAPAAASAPATVKYHVESDPPGADVYRAADGIRVGRTPLDYESPLVRGEMVFLVKRRGYETAELSLPADRDGRLAVTLKKKDDKEERGEKRRQTKRDGHDTKAGDGALDPFR